MTLLELDWTPLWLTFRLAALTTAILLVIGLPLTRVIANPPEGYVAPAPAAAASASAPKASGHNMTWREMM